MPAHHCLCNLYCYGSVGSSATQSTIGSQTVKAAISLSRAMEHWFSKGVMCVQQHAVSPHSRPDLAYNDYGHYISPTSGRPSYAHATTHVQYSTAQQGTVQSSPRTVGRPWTECTMSNGTPAAIRRNFSLCQQIPDRSVSPFDHSWPSIAIAHFHIPGAWIRKQVHRRRETIPNVTAAQASPGTPCTNPTCRWMTQA